MTRSSYHQNKSETKSQLPELSAKGIEPSQAMLMRKEDVSITIRQQAIACTRKQAVGLSTVFLSASSSSPNTTSLSTAVGSRLWSSYMLSMAPAVLTETHCVWERHSRLNSHIAILWKTGLHLQNRKCVLRPQKVIAVKTLSLETVLTSFIPMTAWSLASFIIETNLVMTKELM